MRRIPAAALVIAALAVPAFAQPADPIGALLAQPPAAQADPEEPDTAAEPLAPAPEPEIALPATPQPYAPPPPRLTAPVFVDQTGRNPDAPPSVRDLAYESRLRASFASAQSFLGPLDGAWTLAGPTGGLYELKLVDRGNGVVEGAWRDLRRPGALNASGFVTEIRRDAGQLALRFGPASATFTGGYGGAWTGELTEAGQRRAVTLRKAPPQP
ncbi:hypothetical protein [Phenylobacterium sp.]|jgi:hypothetical protein|uniref:hypothetical protein n=1 Tax=Phenylobacterium sp. TaxID=1871053 RepID=UPI002F94F56B